MCGAPSHVWRPLLLAIPLCQGTLPRTSSGASTGHLSRDLPHTFNPARCRTCWHPTCNSEDICEAGQPKGRGTAALHRRRETKDDKETIMSDETDRERFEQDSEEAGREAFDECRDEYNYAQLVRFNDILEEGEEFTFQDLRSAIRDEDEFKDEEQRWHPESFVSGFLSRGQEILRSIKKRKASNEEPDDPYNDPEDSEDDED